MPEGEVVKDAEGVSLDPPAQESSPEPVEGAPQDKRGPDGWIPKVRFNEVLGERNELRVRAEQEREERIRLEERLKAREDIKVPTKKVATAAELDEFVSRGDMTAVQAADYLSVHAEDRAVAKALAIAERKEAERRRSDRRTSEMQAYASAHPDIMKRGSDTWNKAAEAYQDITFYNGEPETNEQKLTYELMAVRTVLGPVGAIKARQDADAAVRANRETHQDVGNGDQHKTETDEGKIAKLTPRQQDYFRTMQKAGRYPGGIKEYMEELAFVRPVV